VREASRAIIPKRFLTRKSVYLADNLIGLKKVSYSLLAFLAI